jgi:hypothetical protein
MKFAKRFAFRGEAAVTAMYPYRKYHSGSRASKIARSVARLPDQLAQQSRELEFWHAAFPSTFAMRFSAIPIAMQHITDRASRDGQGGCGENHTGIHIDNCSGTLMYLQATTL